MRRRVLRRRGEPGELGRAHAARDGVVRAAPGRRGGAAARARGSSRRASASSGCGEPELVHVDEGDAGDVLEDADDVGDAERAAELLRVERRARQERGARGRLDLGAAPVRPDGDLRPDDHVDGDVVREPERVVRVARGR